MGYKDPDKQREFNRKWRADRRAQWFADKKCVKCESTYRLELDHVDRKTKITNSIWSWSEASRNSELVKCQVLCYACHKAKTKSETPEATHGTLSRYMRYKCRCELCRAAKRIDNSKLYPSRS